MEFKEKLQLLRTAMKLSQEDLAEQLHIARQSVTKWENGRSFPDIRNLIQLSEIFKVSIDRLVKDNDDCSTGLILPPSYSKEDIRRFLVRAKNSCYITGSNTAPPSRPESQDYRYTEDDYLYIDSFLGSENFGGGEAVWVKGRPAWGMNYYGKVLSGNFSSSFLKESLSLVSADKPFRGPEFYKKGDYTYHCEVSGSFDSFHGEEQIYCKTDRVYNCLFHGGSLL